MKWLSNFNTLKKILGLVIIMEVFLGIVGYVGYYYNAKGNQDMAEMYHENMIPVELLYDVRQQARAIEADLFELMITTDGNRNNKLLADIENRMAAVNEDIAKFEKTKLDPEEAKLFSAIKSEMAKYREARKVSLDLAMQNKNAEAYQNYVVNVEPLSQKFHTDLKMLSESNIKQAEQINQKNNENFDFASKVILVMIIGAILLSLALGWNMASSISMPLKVGAEHLDELAKGDFSQDMPPEYLVRKDEVGMLAASMDGLNRNMRMLIHKISNSAEQVAASSEELTAGAQQSAGAANSVAESNTQMAQMADKQAATVKRTVAVIEQISVTTQEIAATAGEAAAIANQAAQATDNGQNSITQAIGQMDNVGKGSRQAQEAAQELKTSAQQIGEIVNMISSIAGQTNLLALNAAIEAARAGEQGRGFAVVAEEVRKLAEQSEQAAQQITELITKNHQGIDHVVASVNSAIENIDYGITLVNNAGSSFTEIDKLSNQVAKQVKNISEVIREVAVDSQSIAESTKEMESMSNDVANEATSISAATEEQLASMEEIASSSQALASLAQELQDAVSKFKV